MQKEVIIIGGGIVGLCCAYYLQKEGHAVTVIDQSDFSLGASYVNAGYITPSHIIPLAAPGMINKGIKWMFNKSSPLYVKPRLNKDFLRWVWLFKKSATPQKVAQAIPVLKNISLLSRALYEEMKSNEEFDFFYQHKGLLMCYQTQKAGEGEWNTGQRALKEGLQVLHLTQQEVQALEPKVALNIKGAVYYQCDAHMSPQNFMEQLKSHLEKVGVHFVANTPINDVQMGQHTLKAIIAQNGTSYQADEFILATGAWSEGLAKKTGLRMPIQAGKGYRIDTTNKTGVSIPAILMEAKVAITPMNGFTRFAGTMELGGINHQINRNRVQAIAKAAARYYKNISLTEKELSNAACGLRPCSPDGLPYIGKTAPIKNLTIATGHAMVGWSLGPVTGKLVSEILGGRKPSLDLSPFAVGRF